MSKIGAMTIKQIIVAHMAMMSGRVMLGEVVCNILANLLPIYVILVLLDSVLYPIKAHVDRLGSPFLDSSVAETCSKRIIGLYGCSWLLVAHSIEGVA